MYKLINLLLFVLAMLVGGCEDPISTSRGDTASLPVQAYQIHLPNGNDVTLVGKSVSGLLGSYDLTLLAATEDGDSSIRDFDIYSDKGGMTLVTITYLRPNVYLSSNDREKRHLLAVNGVVVSISDAIGRPFGDFPLTLVAPISEEGAAIIRDIRSAEKDTAIEP